MKVKSQIMDELAIRRALARIAHEIIEKNQGVENLCLLGVKRRGSLLSQTSSLKLRPSTAQKHPRYWQNM